MAVVVIERELTWPEVVKVARGQASLALSPQALARIARGRAIVEAIIDRGIRAYGVNTGVGALSDHIVPPARLAELSRNILLSHAVGVGAPLEPLRTRAMMTVAVNNFALGHSGVRPEVALRMVDLLNADCVPECPRQGSVGYLSHNAHIGLVLIGEGFVRFDGQRLAARDALSRLGLEPLVLRAKEGLSLVNGTACATGLASLALDQARRLMDWADAVSAMSFEILGGQASGIDVTAMNLRKSPGLAAVTRRLNDLLAGSGLLASAAGTRTQDALSLRSIPQVHGAARDVWTQIEGVISQELASVTDNPAVTGAPEAPRVFSQAHAVGAAVGLAMDQIGVTLAQLGMIAERRIDRLVNPLVSGLPPFLAGDSGVQSGFMIAQYTAASLVAENRRLAAPASLDGGVTSGLQEDMLCHATPAALKALDILANVRVILAIEYLAAAQAYDLTQAVSRAAPATAALHRALRGSIGVYGDERPLGDDIAAVAALIDARTPTEILTGVAAPDRWVA